MAFRQSLAAYLGAGLLLSSVIGASTLLAQSDLSVDLIVPSGQAMPLYLEVFVNGRSTQLIAEFSLDPVTGKISSPRSELIEVGIEPPRGLRGMVSLDRIDGLTYQYDESAQTIALIVDLDARRQQVVSAQRASEKIDADRTMGAVLNYNVSAGVNLGSFDQLDYDGLNLTTNAWIFSPIGILSSANVFSTSPDGNITQLRYETLFEYSAPGWAASVRVGDIVSSASSWSRPIRLGGLQFRRDFGLRSDIVTEPLLSFEGAAAVPSNVDVFIDNNRVYSGNLAEGPYRLEDVPIYNGSGDALIVIRDESGEVTTREVPFFASRNLLKAGVLDYSVEAGFAREGYGTTNADYSEELIYSGSLRFGFTNRLTFEGHFEGKDDLQLFGLGLTAVIANRAEVSFAAGQSTFHGEVAHFGTLSLRSSLAGFDVEASMSRAENGFTDLAYATAADYLSAAALEADGSLLQFPVAQDIISISRPFGDASQHFGFSYVRSDRADSRDEIVSVNYARELPWDNTTLSVSGSYDVANDDTRISAFVNVQLGTAQMQVSTNNSTSTGQSAAINYFQPLGEDIGAVGYSTGMELGDRANALAAAVATRTRYGMGEVTARSRNGEWSLQGRFEGAIVATGGRLATGGTVYDGFAVVDVGVPDVPVLLQNREVAETGRSGRALVPGLSSYNINRISVDTETLPLDATLSATAMDVVPARRSGVLVDLGGQDSATSAVITLTTVTGQALPVGSVGWLNGGGDDVIVGYDGVAFLTGLLATNTLVVQTGAGSCRATFAEPKTGSVQNSLGSVICQ